MGKNRNSGNHAQKELRLSREQDTRRVNAAKAGSSSSSRQNKPIYSSSKDDGKQFGMDKIDAFHSQYDNVSLNHEDEYDDAEEDNEVFGMDDDEDEDDEDSGVGAYYGGEKDDDDDEEEVNDKAWGQKKSKYYRTDYVDELDDDEEAAKEEEKEVQRMQKEKVKTMREEDYDDDTLGSLVTKQTNAAKQGNAKTADTALLAAMNKDLEAIPIGTKQKAKQAATPTQQTNGKSASKETATTNGVKNKKKGKGTTTTSQEDGNVEVETLSRDLASLSSSEKLNFLATESPELLGLLEEFRSKTDEIRNVLVPILTAIKKGELPTSKGISFLEIKYHLLLSYCTNISFYLMLKAEGRPVKNHPVIQQLVKIRAILEKIKPLDNKLKLQIDKLLKTASTGAAGQDPMQFKPRPGALRGVKGAARGDDEDDEGAEDEEEDEEDDSGVFKPSRLMPEHFDAEERRESHLEKKRKDQERRLKHIKSSSIAQYMRDELGDEPEEQDAIGLSMEGQRRKNKFEREVNDRVRYEEENFTRLIKSKTDRWKEHQARKQDTHGGLEDDLETVNDFGDFLTSADGSNPDKQAEEDQAYLEKKRSLARKLSEFQYGGGKAGRSQDQEMQFRDPNAPRTGKRGARAGGDDEGDFGDGMMGGMGDLNEEEDDDTRRATPSKKKAKREEEHERAIKSQDKEMAREKARLSRPLYAPERLLGEGDRRQAGGRIEDNRGLVRPRNKKDKTPHLRSRHRYENAINRRKSTVTPMRDTAKPYMGESGINKNFTKSKRFKD